MPRPAEVWPTTGTLAPGPNSKYALSEVDDYDVLGWKYLYNFGCPWNPVVFPSSDGEVEFAKEEQDPDAKGGERPQPPRIRDDPGNQ